MQFYNYRSVKAIAEYRYPQVKKNQSNASRAVSREIWIPDRSIPVKRKQRSNNRAPDRSRAA